MPFTQDFRTQRRNYIDGQTRIGEAGRLWYDSESNTIRISDGETSGGIVVGGGGDGSYTLPTASTTIKGGVKIDGTTITINDGIISATQQDLSSYATQSYVTSRGYITSYTETDPVFLAHSAYNVSNAKISNWDTAYGWGNHASAGYLTSVGTISYNDLSNKPTLFSGSYTDLTNKPTIPTTVTVNGTTITLGSSGTVTAAANTLTGSTLASGVTASSLTSVGTLSSLTLSNPTSGIALSISAEPYTPVGTQTWTFRTATGLGIPYSSWINFPDGTNQTTAWTGTYSYNDLTDLPTLFSGSYTDLTDKPTIPTTVTVNGTSITLGSSGTVTAAAGTLTGTTLNSTVVTSSLTSLGSLTGLTVDGTGGDLTMTGGAITGVGNITASGTVAVNASGGITTNQTAFDIVNSTATAVNIGGAATAVNIGAITGTLTVNNPTIVGTQTTATLFNTTATTVSAFGAATTATIGATSGTLTLRNPTVVGTQTTVNLWNTTSTTVNAFGAATALNMGASTGTTTINNNLSMASGKTIGTTGSITANASTAFIAGDNAISNVALQMPSESALRNLTNGLTNMYFDVSIGGSTQGQFQFRSSSSYTNVLTMSSTGVTFNTDATVTSRTPSVSRTAFNSAIDTEITLDSMRFRISNQGGIFPQVIGNGSSRNLAWTGVGAISGSAVAQVGSVGTIVADNAWTTLYNLHGMDNAGDTVTVTLQDKAAGRIYRITFVRSDNGSTTGYNIVGERLL